MNYWKARALTSLSRDNARSFTRVPTFALVSKLKSATSAYSARVDNAGRFLMSNSEFGFHVLKTVKPNGNAVYTIGVWQQTGRGSELRAICHVAPIHRALAAVRDELARGGRSSVSLRACS
jgi:hypothetical protein